MPLCDPKGAMPSLLPPPGSLVWVLVISRRSGGCVLRMLRPRASVLSCAHVWGFLCMVHARACFVCFLFSVGPSVGLGVCPSCFVLLCLVFSCPCWGFCHCCFCLFCLFFLLLRSTCYVYVIFALLVRLRIFCLLVVFCVAFFSGPFFFSPFFLSLRPSLCFFFVFFFSLLARLSISARKEENSDSSWEWLRISF